MPRSRVRALAESQTAALTYPQVGATREASPPSGYGHVVRDVVIGAGSEAFERAAAGLLRWQVHRLAGLAPVSDAEQAAEGAVVVLQAGVAPLRLLIPCRVVYTVAEPERRGFAYGTLPGHPEQGEEAFLIERASDGDVHVRIRAFSRPATRLARLGGPITRLVQAYVTDRYVRAARQLAQG